MKGGRAPSRLVGFQFAGKGRTSGVHEGAQQIDARRAKALSHAALGLTGAPTTMQAGAACTLPAAYLTGRHWGCCWTHCRSRCAWGWCGEGRGWVSAAYLTALLAGNAPRRGSEHCSWGLGAGGCLPAFDTSWTAPCRCVITQGGGGVVGCTGGTLPED